MRKFTPFTLAFVLMASAAMANGPLKLLDGDHEQFWLDVEGQGTATSPYVMGSTMLDRERKSPMSTVFGELTTGTRHDDISINFQYGVVSANVTSTSSGTGSISSSNSRASVSTGTGVGLASAESKDALRYRPGHEGTAMFTAVFEPGEAGVDQKMGLLNGVDGLAFGRQGTTFGAWFTSDSVEEFFAQTDFSEDPLDGSGSSGCDLDAQYMNIYKISYGWLGVAPIFYSAYCGFDIGWVLAHVVDKTNSQTTPTIGNPSLPLRLEIERTSGSGADISAYSSSWRAGVVGEAEEDNASNRWSAYTLLQQTIDTDDARNNVFNICNKETYQGKANHTVVELGIATFVNSGNKSVAFYGVTNATVSGATAPVDLNTENSVLTASDDGIITAGARGPATVVVAGGDRRTDVRGTGIRIYPGGCLAFEAVTPGPYTGTIGVSARFVEKF